MIHALMGPRDDRCVHPVYVTQTLSCVRLCPLVQPLGASLPLVCVMLTALEPAAGWRSYQFSLGIFCACFRCWLLEGCLLGN